MTSGKKYKKHTPPMMVRGAMGIAVEISHEEFNLLVGEQQKKQHKVLRRRAVFYKGVSPRYDALVEAGKAKWPKEEDPEPEPPRPPAFYELARAGFPPGVDASFDAWFSSLSPAYRWKLTGCTKVVTSLSSGKM